MPSSHSVGMESVPFERVLGKEVGAGFMKNLEKKGIKFIMEAGVESFVPSSTPSADFSPGCIALC